MSTVATELVCPECMIEGITRVFDRAQSLGKHRKDAHGVAGTSRSAKRNTRINAEPVREKPMKLSAMKLSKSEKIRSLDTIDGVFNRDAALKLLFPSGGIPASYALLEEVNTWLVMGEHIAANHQLASAA